MFNESEIDWSYYDISQVKNRILQGEPVFCIRGTDPFAPDIIREYANRLIAHPNTNDRQLFNKGIASNLYAAKVEEWQAKHPMYVKMPDLPTWMLTPDMIMLKEPTTTKIIY